MGRSYRRISLTLMRATFLPSRIMKPTLRDLDRLRGAGAGDAIDSRCSSVMRRGHQPL
jgi:hypothetical protein